MEERGGPKCQLRLYDLGKNTNADDDAFLRLPKLQSNPDSLGMRPHGANAATRGASNTPWQRVTCTDQRTRPNRVEGGGPSWRREREALDRSRVHFWWRDGRRKSNLLHGPFPPSPLPRSLQQDYYGAAHAAKVGQQEPQRRLFRRRHHSVQHRFPAGGAPHSQATCHATSQVH